MSKKLTLEHADDEFFAKAMSALASQTGVAADASDEDKQAAAEVQIRGFLREAVKQDEMRKFEAAKRVERKELSKTLDTTLDEQAALLTVTIE